jgi:hypothetical protein
LDDLTKLIKGEKSDKTSTTCKLKHDFSVITFGEHYTLVKKKDVMDNRPASMLVQFPDTAVMRTCLIVFFKCHVKQERHPGIRKME